MRRSKHPNPRGEEDAPPRDRQGQDGWDDADSLMENKAVHRLLIESLPDAVVLYDPQGRVLYLNPAFEQTYGWTREECLGRRIDFVPPEEREITARAITRTLAGETVELETQRLTKSGERRDMLLKTTPFRQSDGRLVGIYVIHRDVTERKAAQAALKESEERYRLLLESSPDPISVYDAEGRVAYVNPAFEQTFGWTRGELAGRGIDFVPPHEVERTRDAVQRTLLGENVLLETQRLTKDGRLLDIQLRTACFYDRQGRLAGDIVIYRDISQRKKAEEELKRHRDHLEELVDERTRELQEANRRLRQEVEERRRAEEETRASEQRFRDLFNSISDLIYTQDMQGRFISVNQAVARVLGYSTDYMVGRKAAEFMLPKYRNGFEEYLRTIKEKGHMEGISKYLGRNGEVRYLEYRSTLVTPKEGEPYISGTGRDVTERMLAEREMRRLQRQLQQAQKMEATGTLAGGVAHDFNNILQAMGGYVEVLAQAEGLGRDNRRRVEHIARLMRRASGLIRQLLTFSRRLEPEMRLVDLNREVRQAAELLERTIPKMISIKTELAPDLYPVQGDQSQLEQILLNLGANARDAMPSGGQLTIRTENLEVDEAFCKENPGMVAGTYVRLTVADTGQGMEPEVLDQIYDPFFTTKPVGEGTGLGLSTVYGIVKSHGGYITCQSRLGRGTTFHIYLPAARPAQEARPAEETLARGEMEAVRGSLVMVVDDEPDILHLVSESLERSGCRVITAGSGEEALQRLTELGCGVDLVVLDIGMPGMGGPACLQEIKRLDPEVKVLISSGYLADGQVNWLLEQGAQAYLAKPYKLSDLLAKVNDLLAAARSA